MIKTGILAAKLAGQNLPLQVISSRAGYYIGTMNEEGPVSRESVEYFQSDKIASNALERGSWTQREYI
ncbi:hypothetical protein [Xenorhabdus cabanillasii]|uniref:Uncharacterized protein n=1 Tax=Xenorhabdus cabanillasii JM26 TaxID=1427517 RepID=W1J6E9_9GAMM|nr:hypothetical protein [Xenorhabdus cabanillasii]PHM75749.1 hypothetical protein Xcab_03735 [Xenorhabdus cabanillasii JM26]CDL86332.1 conserved hypothetical protein [Xenorhabdus cabanillasii JM26]